MKCLTTNESRFVSVTRSKRKGKECAVYSSFINQYVRLEKKLNEALKVLCKYQ